MPNIKISLKSPGFTPVDNTFIDNYLRDIRGDFLKVYLFCLRQGFAEKQFNISYISSKLGMLDTDVQKAFEELNNSGFLSIENSGTVEIKSLSEKRDNEIVFDNTLRDMFTEVEQCLGRPLSFRDIDILKSIYSDYELSPEVITILVGYCVSKNKADIIYIEKTALNWHESGVKTPDDALNIIEQYTKKWNKYREILKYLGKTGSDITKPQENLFNKWLFTYKFSNDIIFKACDICILKTNGTNLNYIDKILEDWHKKGVKTINDTNIHKRASYTPKMQPPSYKPLETDEYAHDVSKIRRQLLGLGDDNEI